eukprot:CAMPEP_0177688034 /NCGR_PEP_ID=MMETSP0447-20121125/34448_1 /TAXON_ID=0 /ORGANISM="Stygamoeba regulata, Strain BSH-02190019" /LENGTH=236 /DNA_ID=CAMNT_0019198319 /DNA_START=61 /DNA_END=771 /DNA_ORIENTATION=-
MALPTTTWDDLWTDIVSGGNMRWKRGEAEGNYKRQFEFLHRELTKHHPDRSTFRFLVPLSGDCPFVRYAWSLGHSVCAVDLSKVALAALRAQFAEDSVSWEESQLGEDGARVWRSQDGRLEVVCCELITSEATGQLVSGFDAVLDKDAFGALAPEVREAYVKRITPLLAPHAQVLLEGKQRREEDREAGPPFHLDLDKVKTRWPDFDVVYLGEMPEQPYDIASMKQIGFHLTAKQP